MIYLIIVLVAGAAWTGFELFIAEDAPECSNCKKDIEDCECSSKFDEEWEEMKKDWFI